MGWEVGVCLDEHQGHSTTPESTQSLCMTGRGCERFGEGERRGIERLGDASNALQQLWRRTLRLALEFKI